jgi:lipid-A-disaccharide synthase
MSGSGPNVFIVAIENSGDHLGASLIAKLREADSSVSIKGIGGPAMRAQNVPSELSIEGLSILGFSEALRAYPLVRQRVKETVEIIRRVNPDCAVLIDSWGFMIRVAQRLKKLGYKGKIIKYVAPQVFAMREGRARILARSVDHLLSIHNFDAPYFTRHGLDVTHIGNPMFDTDYSAGDADALREEIGARKDQLICAIFFGSRPSEFHQLKEPITKAVDILSRDYPDLLFVSPISDSLWDIAGEETRRAALAPIICLKEAQKFNIFAAADLALACSGTITTQLASVGIPAVVVYRLKALTWAIASRLYKQEYVSLVNISAGAALMPERLQTQATGENLAKDIAHYLDNENLRAESAKRLRAQANIMRGSGGSASRNAAAKILALIA